MKRELLIKVLNKYPGLNDINKLFKLSKEELSQILSSDNIEDARIILDNIQYDDTDSNNKNKSLEIKYYANL